MTVRNVARIDSFMIYFDQVLVIRWLPSDHTMMEIVYKDAPSLLLNKEYYWDRIAALVPPSLLWYPMNNMWVNDDHICYVEKRWDIRKKMHFLVTSISSFGEVHELGLSDFDDLLASRYEESSSASYVEKQEVQQLINTEIVTNFSSTIETVIEEKLDLTNITSLFNETLQG